MAGKDDRGTIPQGKRIMSTSSHFAYLIEIIRNSWSLLRMALNTDSDVYYPERYYYSLSNLDASALNNSPWTLTTSFSWWCDSIPPWCRSDSLSHCSLDWQPTGSQHGRKGGNSEPDWEPHRAQLSRSNKSEFTFAPSSQRTSQRGFIPLHQRSQLRTRLAPVSCQLHSPIYCINFLLLFDTKLNFKLTESALIKIGEKHQRALLHVVFVTLQNDH